MRLIYMSACLHWINDTLVTPEAVYIVIVCVRVCSCSNSTAQTALVVK